MRMRHAVAIGVLLSGLTMGSALAADGSASAAPQGAVQALAQEAQQGGQQGDVVAPGQVPQAQIDYFNKKEEARQRRDEALKMRQQMMQAGQ